MRDVASVSTQPKLRARNIVGFMLRYRNWLEVTRAYAKGLPVSAIHPWGLPRLEASDVHGGQLLVLFNEIWKLDAYRCRNHRSAFFIGRTDAVIDIGANMGLFTLLAARLADRGRVIAFEPHPGNFACLARHVKAADCKNVELVNTAIGERSGRAVLSCETFVTHRIEPQLELRRDQPTNGAKSVQITVGNLSEFIDERRIDRVDYLKIDAEGSELEILKGLAADHVRIVRRVVLEYHDSIRPGTRRGVLELLERWAFSVAEDVQEEGLGKIFAVRRESGAKRRRQLR
jgi:FkbM family methyltransferase